MRACAIQGGKTSQQRGGKGIETGYRDLRIGRVDHSGKWIDHGHRQVADAVVNRRQRVEIQIALQLAVAFVITEEEQPVLDDRAANGGSELVAL